jgi:hypothetical protein
LFYNGGLKFPKITNFYLTSPLFIGT